MKRIKKYLKPFVVFAIGSVGGVLQEQILRNSVTIFCYHDVTNLPSDFSRENSLNVTTEVFDYQISFIKKNYNVIGPEQLLGQTLPSNPALITFDDGFKSFFTNAVPILEKYKIPVLIFLNMAPIRGEIFWSGLIVYLCTRRKDFIDYLNRQLSHSEIDSTYFLSCSQQLVENYLNNTNEDLQEKVNDYVGVFASESDLETCSNNPYVFYGNHGYNHYVSCLMSDDEFLNDVARNEQILRAYPNYLNYFAFPFGQPKQTFTDTQVRLLLDSGVKKVFFSSASSQNTFPFSSLLDRIVLTSESNSSTKIDYSVMRPWFLNKQKNLIKYFT